MNGLRKTTAKTITLDINLIKKVEQLAVKENRNFSLIWSRRYYYQQQKKTY